MGRAVAGGAHVAGVDGDFRPVVVEQALPFEDIEELRLVLVAVGADGAARLQRGVGEQAGVAVQGLFIRQVLEVGLAVAVPDALVPPDAVLVACYHGECSFRAGWCPASA